MSKKLSRTAIVSVLSTAFAFALSSEPTEAQTARDNNAIKVAPRPRGVANMGVAAPKPAGIENKAPAGSGAAVNSGGLNVRANPQLAGKPPTVRGGKPGGSLAETENGTEDDSGMGTGKS